MVRDRDRVRVRVRVIHHQQADGRVSQRYTARKRHAPSPLGASPPRHALHLPIHLADLQPGHRRRRQARERRKKESERAAKLEAQRSERERRKHGKSELAIELELMRLTPAERERRQPCVDTD